MADAAVPLPAIALPDRRGVRPRVTAGRVLRRPKAFVIGQSHFTSTKLFLQEPDEIFLAERRRERLEQPAPQCDPYKHLRRREDAVVTKTVEEPEHRLTGIRQAEEPRPEPGCDLLVVGLQPPVG